MERANNYRKRLGYGFIPILVALLSCAKEYTTDSPESALQRDYADIVVDNSSILYKVISDDIATKSLSVSDTASLESMLDRERTKEDTFEQFNIVEIPFKEIEYDEQVSLSDSLKDYVDMSEITEVRKSLVETRDNETGISRTYVVTYIPSRSYIDKYGSDSYTYVNKSEFDGLIMYSHIDGSLSNIYKYGDHPILLGYMNDSVRNHLYINIISNRANTKSGPMDDVIDASICVGYVDDHITYEQVEQINKWKKEFYKDIGTGPGEDPDMPDCGGGGDGSDYELEPGFIEDVAVYRVKLSNVGPGSVAGEGKYPKGKLVTCAAYIYMSEGVFDRWRGDYSSSLKTITFEIKRHMSMTGYFYAHDDTVGLYRPPCRDNDKGITNPVKEMRVAATNTWGDAKGGTYGYTRRYRDGRPKWHGGLDLYAEPGTPLYAMIDGVIGSRYVTEQPNRNKDDDYPSGYTGDENGAGNRVYLEGEHQGNQVRLGYCHLQAGNPVAVNPRTGLPFAPGDKVYAGELLAYAGRTGNAHNVPEPHLHLSYQVGYASRNPEELINGKVDWKNGHVFNPIIGGIKCDSDIDFPIYFPTF